MLQSPGPSKDTGNGVGTGWSSLQSKDTVNVSYWKFNMCRGCFAFRFIDDTVDGDISISASSAVDLGNGSSVWNRSKGLTAQPSHLLLMTWITGEKSAAFKLHHSSAENVIILNTVVQQFLHWNTCKLQFCVIWFWNLTMFILNINFNIVLFIESLNMAEFPPPVVRTA